MSRLLRLLVNAAVLLTTVFALIVGGLRAQPRSDPLEADLSHCAMPCWKGITPGSTSGEDALAVLDALTGLEPYQASCYQPPSDMCRHYSWLAANSKTPAAEMAIQRQAIQTVLFYAPGITLGDALLALDRLGVPFDGVDENDTNAGRIYVRLLFAHTRLLIDVQAPCPGDDLDLMEAPITSIEVVSVDFQASLPPPIPSLAAERQTFARICALQ
ncbi:MAG TPA: hypothetical protein VHD90_00400 [Phototrophicaceae bacterium]|nr:hypothetical protein [Phototrophicaceae bacterium]